jgi:hypothetical protein
VWLRVVRLHSGRLLTQTVASGDAYRIDSCEGGYEALMSAQNPRAYRRSHKPPPLRSYIPFTIFCAVCLSLLVGVVVGIDHLVAGSGGHPMAVGDRRPAAAVQHRITRVPTATPLIVSTARRTSSRPGRSVYGPPLVMPPPHSVATVQTSGMPVMPTSELAATSTRALPLVLPTPTATPDGNASVVIARDVDNNGNPLQPSRRFLSPALRLYAVVTLRTVSPSDMLRFVFERSGKVLPGDVISYAAGGTASTHDFSAYADYHNGTTPLPHGNYRLLFYRNGRLEAVAHFEVG